MIRAPVAVVCFVSAPCSYTYIHEPATNPAAARYMYKSEVAELTECQPTLHIINHATGALEIFYLLSRMQLPPGRKINMHSNKFLGERCSGGDRGAPLTNICLWQTGLLQKKLKHSVNRSQM